MAGISDTGYLQSSVSSGCDGPVCHPPGFYLNLRSRYKIMIMSVIVVLFRFGYIGRFWHLNLHYLLFVLNVS